MYTTKKISSLFAISILLVSIFGLQAVRPSKSTASANVTITSPTANQSISGTSFTVTGTASPNTTVVISVGQNSFAQTISDSSGNWKIDTSLPAGNIALTAKAVQNPTYGYFPTSTDFFSTASINRIRLSDNAINPSGGGWPIASTTGIVGLIPSEKSNYFYSTNPFTNDKAPGKFNPLDIVDTAITTGYPANARANAGAYSPDGSKYYSTNMELQSLSVIDTATNAWVKDIPLGDNDLTTWNSPTGKVYTTLSNNQLKVIDTTSDTVEKTIIVPCATPDGTSSITFSQDANYPYYYTPCNNDGTFIKFKTSDDTAVGTINVGLTPSTGVLSLDNKRLFFTSIFQNPNSNMFRVVNVEDGSEITTKTLTAGALGIIATSDFQKIYIATPGNAIDTSNIDVMNTENYDITSVSTPAIPGLVSTLPTDTSEASVQVAFVLGAATSTPTPGTLAETGIVAVSSTLLLGFIIASIAFVYVDYRKHKQPLKAVDPNVHYTFMHHVKVVSIPLLRYRLTFSLIKNRANISRF